MKVVASFELRKYKSYTTYEHICAIQLISEDPWAIYCMQRGGSGKYFSSYEHLSDYIKYRFGLKVWRELQESDIPKSSGVIDSLGREEWYEKPMNREEKLKYIDKEILDAWQLKNVRVL